jgi:hypothetical protein
MALDESTEGLAKLDSNSVIAYIDPSLYSTVSLRGDIYLDFGADRFGAVGYSIAVKKNHCDKDCSCSG